MKREYDRRPEGIGELYGFKAWQEHVAAVPSPLVAVTGYKANGMANLTMQSWCGVHGDRVMFMSVERDSHMYGVLRETGVAVVNFPTAETFNRCMRSIEHNGWDEDEISECGLTMEDGHLVDAPRIAECPLCLECELMWEHDAAEDSSDVTVCMRIVNIAVEPEGYSWPLYNLRSRTDPETGERAGPQVGAIVSLGGYDGLPG